MMTTATMPQLADRVQFRDHNGLPKAALVTGTWETIDNSKAGDGVPRIEDREELHLVVFSANGSTEVRHNIRRGTAPGQWAPISGSYTS